MNSELNNPGTPDIHAFAPAARKLLQEGQVEEAFSLCSDGVRDYPYYATGHFVLGLTSIAAGRYEEARPELERALELDGPSPTLLDALIVCYDELGLNDLAGECRELSTELDPGLLIKAEDEGGPEMVDEPDTSLEPDSGDESRLGGADTGSPEDALKELEALLDSAGLSPEGEEEQPEVEEPVAEEPAAEPEPEVAVPFVEEPVSPEEEPAAEPEPEVSAPLMEEPAIEEVDTVGAEEEIEAVPADSLSAIELDAEPGEKIEPVEAGAGGEPAAGADDATADMWKKIMEQADEVSAGDYAGIDDLKSIVKDEEEEVEAESEAVPADSLSAMELDSGLTVGEVSESAAEVEEVEGLEIPETAEGVAEVEPLDIEPVMMDSGSGEETAGVDLDMGDEDLVAGPVELSDETLEMAAEGIEMDTPFEAVTPGEGGEEEMPGEEPVIEMPEMEEPVIEEPVIDEGIGVHEPEEVDVDDALRALEEELGTVSEEETGIEEEVSIGDDALDLGEDLITGEEEPAVAEEAVGEFDLDTDITLDEVEVAPAVEEVEVEMGPSTDAGIAEGTGEVPFSAAPGPVQITSAEDSIKVAIQAEILLAKGNTEAAVKLFEALHLWSPDRASFKERVEELRRQLRGGEGEE